MNDAEPVTILMVDDHPSKLLTYEVILHDLGEHLLTARSGRDALDLLLKHEIALILLDVQMPEINGFELATMIRQHPRYQQTAILFISGMHPTDLDMLKGYALGAVDYLTVPIIPELLRAKVRAFADFYRRTRALERRYAAQAQDVRAHLAAIVESSEDAILSKTMAGIIQSWNQAAERLYGYTAAEVIGQSITLLIPPDLADDFPMIMARLTRGERIEHYETQRVTKDGTRLDVALTISPIRESTGQMSGASVIARDITARKQMEAALQTAYATLEQRVAERTAALREEMAERQRLEREVQRAEHFALLGRLAAGVSHEIRNPLSAIYLHVDLVEEELRQPSPESTTTMADALTEIKTQLARLDDLLQDYLSLARVATSERIPQDLGALVHAWAQEWRRLPAPHRVMLRVEGLADLGTVAVHPSTLRRALLNLVQNALEAMPEGGTLTLRGAGTATHVQLQVCDTGSGIPAAQLGQIFEPLHTTKPEGTGLGLYITREIVAAHGGQVMVESVVGQGTTFTLTLPRAGA
jgi:PAS domain S-box-containing protein